MLRNHLTIAFRSLWKNRTYSAINVFGLAVGLAAAVLLLLWVQDERSYDGFHAHADRIYRQTSTFSQDGQKQTWEGVPAATMAFARREVPEIELAALITTNYDVTLFSYGNKNFIEKGNAAYVEGSFFQLFSFPFLKGNPKKPFTNNRSVVITETMAEKYFGPSWKDSENPIGKIIRTDKKEDYEVSGVIQDIPANSHFAKYSFFFTMDIYAANFTRNGGNGEWKTIDVDWGNYYYEGYWLLKPNTSPEMVAKKLTGIHHRNQKGSEALSYSLLPLSNMHLYNADGTEGRIQTVRIFGIVALVILLIACINYVNLSTARATKRAKEVGIRKIVGAERTQLFGQFLGESLITFGLALVLALGLISFFLPTYNTLSGKAMTLDLLNPTTLAVLGFTLLATVLVAGVYPALLLSSFPPLTAMKGKLTLGGVSFRKVLVITQFSLSITLIVGTLVISKQLAYIRQKELGYDKENVFAFWMRGDMNQRFEHIRTELTKQTGVLGVAVAGGEITNVDNSTGDTDWDGKAPNRQFIINPLSVDKDFLSWLP
jgi:putative ABC transport system permease protein